MGVSRVAPRCREKPGPGPRRPALPTDNAPSRFRDSRPLEPDQTSHCIGDWFHVVPQCRREKNGGRTGHLLQNRAIRCPKFTLSTGRPERNPVPRARRIPTHSPATPQQGGGVFGEDVRCSIVAKIWGCSDASNCRKIDRIAMRSSDPGSPEGRRSMRLTASPTFALALRKGRKSVETHQQFLLPYASHSPAGFLIGSHHSVWHHVDGAGVRSAPRAGGAEDRGGQ